MFFVVFGGIILSQEYKEREAEAAKLRREEEKIIEEQIELEKIQKEREKMEERRKQLKLQRYKNLLFNT